MLEAIRRERRECLEFSGGNEPLSDMPPMHAPPRLDGPRDVRAPHHREREREKEEILLPVAQLDETMQHADRTRRNDALRGERAVKEREAGRGEPLRLELFEQVAEDVEIVRGDVGAPESPIDTFLLRPRERDLNGE